MSRTDGLDGVIVRLIRRLRGRGVPASAAAGPDALRAVTVVGLADRDDVRLALRATLIHRPEDVAPFEEEFARAWDAHGDDTSPAAPVSARPPVLAATTAPVTLASWMRGDDAADGEAHDVPSPSAEERLSARDFSRWPATDEHAMQRLADRIARRLILRRSRRWRRARRGRVDLRETVRASVRDGGELVRLVRRTRRLRRTRLVALCDVSGSMELYVAFLLPFLHALQNTMASVDTYFFATRLTRATDALRGGGFRSVLRDLGGLVRDWSGGTRIGDAVATLLREHGGRMDRRTVVVVLSDGWDVGDPEVLGQAMSALRQRVGRIIWLNPLMGAAGYAPETRGMQAALPSIDLLAPGHSLEAIEAVIPRLAL